MWGDQPTRSHFTATKNRSAFVAVALTLVLAGIGATIVPSQASDSAIAWDAVSQLAATVLPNVAFANSLDQQRPQPRMTFCAKEGGFFRRLWDGIKGAAKRVIEWVRNNCSEGGGSGMFGVRCEVTFG